MIFSTPKVIFKTSSPLSGEIVVRESGEERSLLVGGLVQSVNLKTRSAGGRVWGGMARLASRLNHSPKAVLILGLGGGTVAHFLVQKYPGVVIEAVELDPVIVEVGKKYFDFDKLPNFSIIVGDALALVEEKRGAKYDIVYVDTFCGDKFCAGFERVEFLLRLRDLLRPGGAVVFNRLSREDLREGLKEFEERLRSAFSKVETVRVGNLVYFNQLFFCQR